MTQEAVCGCGLLAVEWCHASCCSGETPCCEKHNHRFQWVLDKLGYPAGSLGDDNTVSEMVETALVSGWISPTMDFEDHPMWHLVSALVDAYVEKEGEVQLLAHRVKTLIAAASMKVN